MSDEAAPKAEKPAKKGGGLGLILGILLPALASAGAAFGAVKATSKHVVTEVVVEHKEAKPPGPTMALEPFLVNILDEKKKQHPMKLTVAVEFDEKTKEELLKSFTPRIRDAILAYVRSMTFEEATDGEHAEKLRKELLKRCQEAGANGAERILITDMVAQ